MSKSRDLKSLVEQVFQKIVSSVCHYFLIISYIKMMGMLNQVTRQMQQVRNVKYYYNNKQKHPIETI